MRVIFTLGLLISVASFGSLPQKYPKRLDGTLISNIRDTTPIHIVTGAPQTCEKRELSDWVLFKCTSENSYALVSQKDADPLHLKFDRILVNYSKYKQTMYRKYVLSGNWIDRRLPVPVTTEVKLTLINFDDNPTEFKGTLEMVDYELKQAIQAKEVPAN